MEAEGVNQLGFSVQTAQCAMRSLTLNPLS